MGKQQRDNAMFEYLELYVHADIITDNHDLFSQLKTTFRHAFRTCSLKSVLWVDQDVLEPGFVINYTVLHKTKTIVTYYSSRQQHTRTRLYCFLFQHPSHTWFSTFLLFICLLKYLFWNSKHREYTYDMEKHLVHIDITISTDSVFCHVWSFSNARAPVLVRWMHGVRVVLSGTLLPVQTGLSTKHSFKSVPEFLTEPTVDDEIDGGFECE